MLLPDAERFVDAMRSAEDRAAGKDLRMFAASLATPLLVKEQ